MKQPDEFLANSSGGGLWEKPTNFQSKSGDSCSATSVTLSPRCFWLEELLTGSAAAFWHRHHQPPLRWQFDRTTRHPRLRIKHVRWRGMRRVTVRPEFTNGATVTDGASRLLNYLRHFNEAAPFFSQLLCWEYGCRRGIPVQSRAKGMWGEPGICRESAGIKFDFLEQP